MSHDTACYFTSTLRNSLSRRKGRQAQGLRRRPALHSSFAVPKFRPRACFSSSPLTKTDCVCSRTCAGCIVAIYATATPRPRPRFHQHDSHLKTLERVGGHRCRRRYDREAEVEFNVFKFEFAIPLDRVGDAETRFGAVNEEGWEER